MKHLQPTLVQEIASLRKGEGMTPVKLGGVSAIRHIAARVEETPVDNITDSQVYNFLLSELSRLSSDVPIVALVNALGISSSSKSLSLRRSQLAAKLNKHPDTIERYENQGVNQFAAYLAERNLVSEAGAAPYSSSLYLKELETQARTARTMTAIGLSGHLSLPSHGEELIKYLEMPRKPYMNATVNISLLPSSYGAEWYRFRLSYLFQGGRESFRVAVVLNNNDGEQLMASGLVDDFHRLDNPHNPERDIKTLIANSKFIARNSVTHAQKLFRFRELEADQALRIFDSTGKPLKETCRFLEIAIPLSWQTDVCTYEYISWINLRLASVAYWYSPTLMYLKKLTLDFSQFPQVEKRDFFLLPFLGHAPGTELGEDHLYVLKLNNWIMPGHGIVLGWEDKSK